MAHDNSRGKIYEAKNDTTFDMGKVESEDVRLDGGILKAAIPLLGPAGNIMAGLLGKTRIISVEGHFYGTQAQLETFIEQFTDHFEASGDSEPLRYYPLFHPDNTLAGSNQQDQYYQVLISVFSYQVSEKDGGFLLTYDLELIHGLTLNEEGS